MPRVKIDTTVVTIELEAAEKSIDDLGKQAMDMFEQASKIMKELPAGPAFGFGNEKRWTPNTVHHSQRGYGFGEVQA
jgi:hypothetical protein